MSICQSDHREKCRIIRIRAIWLHGMVYFWPSIWLRFACLVVGKNLKTIPQMVVNFMVMNPMVSNLWKINLNKSWWFSPHFFTFRVGTPNFERSSLLCHVSCGFGLVLKNPVPWWASMHVPTRSSHIPSHLQERPARLSKEKNTLPFIPPGKDRWLASPLPWTSWFTMAPSWRIIPVSKWLVTPVYKPFRPFGRWTTPFRGLTNHGY